jgi:MFS family permease
MQDYPATAKFLTQEERDEISARLKRDRSSLADEFDIKYFWAAIKDWKIWVHMFITIGVYTGLYSYSLFLPTIINDLGTARTPEMAQLMTVPPYVVACIFCVGSGWYADKLGQRGLFMIGFMVVAYVSRVHFSFPRKAERANWVITASLGSSCSWPPPRSPCATSVASSWQQVRQTRAVYPLGIK